MKKSKRVSDASTIVKRSGEPSAEFGKLPFDLTDAEIANAVRSLATHLGAKKNAAAGGASWSAAMLLCSLATECNADTLTIDIDGATFKGKPIGSWKVKASRCTQRSAEPRRAADRDLQ